MEWEKEGDDRGGREKYEWEKERGDERCHASLWLPTRATRFNETHTGPKHFARII